MCPLPVLRARKRLLSMAEGEELSVLATDAAAVLDMPHFAREAGHQFLGSEDLGQGVRRYRFRRGPDRPEVE